jgi:hypothetical protein
LSKGEQLNNLEVKKHCFTPLLRRRQTKFITIQNLLIELVRLITGNPRVPVLYSQYTASWRSRKL